MAKNIIYLTSEDSDRQGYGLRKRKNAAKVDLTLLSAAQQKLSTKPK